MAERRDHYGLTARYNRWLNERLYDACETLTDAGRKRDHGAFSARSTRRSTRDKSRRCSRKPV